MPLLAMFDVSVRQGGQAAHRLTKDGHAAVSLVLEISAGGGGEDEDATVSIGMSRLAGALLMRIAKSMDLSVDATVKYLTARAGAGKAPFAAEPPRAGSRSSNPSATPWNMNEDFWNTVDTLASTREANVETWFVLPLLAAFDHDPTCVDSEAPIVFQECRDARPGRKFAAYFVVYADRPFSRATFLIVVESQRTGETLDKGREQGESYAQNLRAPILLMTNGRQLEI